jgi:CheY-like chemotaxis protein
MAQPRRLLLAEDDPVSRAFLHEALSSAGHAVTSVADGADALSLASTRAFDLLLLDLHLPTLHGPALLARLRDTDGALSRQTPALALTAENDPRVHAELGDGGFAAVLCKPLTVDRLLQAVAAIGSVEQAGHAKPWSAVDGSDLAPAADSAALIWNDALALAATGGNADIVESLRTLMLQELPLQRSRTLGAVARGDRSTAAAELHRLRAACGFCAATRLPRSVDALAAALDADRATVSRALDGFERASAELLESASVSKAEPVTG